MEADRPPGTRPSPQLTAVIGMGATAELDTALKNKFTVRELPYTISRSNPGPTSPLATLLQGDGKTDGKDARQFAAEALRLANEEGLPEPTTLSNAITFGLIGS